MFNSIRNKMSAWFGMAMGVLAQNAGADNSVLEVLPHSSDNWIARFRKTHRQVDYVPSQKLQRSEELVAELKDNAAFKRARKVVKRLESQRRREAGLARNAAILRQYGHFPH